MGKNFTAVFAVCLSVAALPLACGGDDDDGGDGGGTTGGKGGSSGSSTGGSATGGKGGMNTGGAAPTGGKGGMNTGGAAPTGGTAGMGGAEGGMGGAEGGMGGEGGGPTMSLCEQVCSGPPGNCASDCETGYCAQFLTTQDCTEETETLLTCFLTDLGASSWVCTAGVPQYAGDECYDEFMASYAAGCIAP